MTTTNDGAAGTGETGKDPVGSDATGNTPTGKDTRTGKDAPTGRDTPLGKDAPTGKDTPPADVGGPAAPGVPPSHGVPASELSDEDLEHHGTQAHLTRNWVFLHGTVEQFETHTERMLELEQEYLRRHPKRTWQGAEGGEVPGDERDYLARIAGTPGGQMHKLEAHHAARELGLRPERVAALHRQDPPLLTTDGDYRVLTDAGRTWLENRN